MPALVCPVSFWHEDSDSQVADDEDELTGTDATPAGTPSARRRPGREFGDGRGRGGQLSRRQRKNRKQLAEGRAAGEQGASSTAGTAAVAAAGSGTTVHINGNGKSKKKSQSLPLYTALNISDEKIYEALERYSLTQMALQKFGFPVESEERPGLVCIIVNQSSGGGGGGARGGGGNNGRNNEDVPSEADEQEADRVLNPNAREFRPRSQPQSPRMPKRGVNGEEGASETKSELYSPPTLKTSSSSQTLSPTAEEFVPKSARCMSRPQHFHQESPTGGGNDVFRTPLSRRGNAGNGEASMRRVASEPVKMDSEMASASKPKLCMRCSRHFHVEDGVYLQREKCVYHWAKAKMKRHQCCGRPRGALGCQEAEVHVWKGLDAVDRQYLDNFVVTKLPRRALSSNYGSTFFPGVFAMDAEMAFTAYGLELIRLTVVGLDGRLVYEAYVRPEHHIVDYNTRYSGLSARELDRLANKTLKQVQNDLMGFLSARSILIGHGLENDLRVLRLVHTTVIDTSIVFMEEGGSSMRPSLKHLAKVRLDKNIQTSDYGHDSKEDAVTCMELMLLKVGEDLRRGGIICP